MIDLEELEAKTEARIKFLNRKTKVYDAKFEKDGDMGVLFRAIDCTVRIKELKRMLSELGKIKEPFSAEKRSRKNVIRVRAGQTFVDVTGKSHCLRYPFEIDLNCCINCAGAKA